MIRNDGFDFNGRNRRPPRDPINALLSFVYTLLDQRKSWPRSNRPGWIRTSAPFTIFVTAAPSLACDLVEEYRSFLGDRLVLGLVNRRAVRPEDFVFRKGAPSSFIDEEDMKRRRPVEMKPAVGRVLLSAYEEMMKTTMKYPPIREKYYPALVDPPTGQGFCRVPG